MLHHVSFSVHAPERAASIAAALMGGSAVRGPSPPFPSGTWFALAGDDGGSLIELTPWGTIVDPQAGLARDDAMRPRTASHVLASTPLPAERVVALAEREGLRVAAVDAGLFRFLKVWIEDSFLLELLTPEHRNDYVACFGAHGIERVDERLRTLERTITAAMRSASPGQG
jgi:hypothetical protein